MEFLGSPFALSVSSPPDPSKVRVYGPGVEHGILSKFKSDFSVDTQGAGAGQLTVRVRGPKGNRAISELFDILVISAVFSRFQR